MIKDQRKALMSRKIQKILIANRGVTAVRIMHTCRDRKIPTTSVYSTPDRLAHHVFMGDSAVHIGEAPPAESYLNMEKMISAAIESGSDAIHPGWGFLAENHKFARMVIDAGLTWIGPPPNVIKALGDKVRAKKLAQKANVPTKFASRPPRIEQHLTQTVVKTSFIHMIYKALEIVPIIDTAFPDAGTINLISIDNFPISVNLSLLR